MLRPVGGRTPIRVEDGQVVRKTVQLQVDGMSQG